MSKQFSMALDGTLVSADLHLNHANIISSCDRPFLQPGDRVPDPEKPGSDKWVSAEVKHQRAREMSAHLAAQWKLKVQDHFTVYHLGDYCFTYKGSPRPWEWERVLPGKTIHIRGNHDHRSKVLGLESAILKVAGYTFWLQHRPVTAHWDVPDFVDAVLCGHVHNLWTHKWVEDLLMVNVGVDVRGFAPMTMREVVQLVEKLLTKGPPNG